MKHSDMYQSIEDEVCRHLDLFDKWFKGRTFYQLSRPEIIFAPLTIDAGQCMYEFVEMNYVVGNLVFNSHMIPDNFIKYIEVVVPHEVSHWCHAVLHGYINDEEQNLNHGVQWKQLMQLFEANDSSTIFGIIAPPVDGLKQYGCSCCIINLDEDDIENYADNLFCDHCQKEYKPLNKGEKMK